MKSRILLIGFFIAGIYGFTLLSAADGVGHANVKDGDLAKTKDNPDVYILKIKNGKYFRRLILNPNIFNSYKHLSWDNIKVVEQRVLDEFTDSQLVMEVDGAGKPFNGLVFRLYSDSSSDTGVKRHLDITAQKFEESGYDWDAIYKINSTEAGNNFYILGPPLQAPPFFPPAPTQIPTPTILLTPPLIPPIVKKTPVLVPEPELPLRTVEVLSVPFPDTFYCFNSKNRKNPECARYYTPGVCKDFGNLPPPPGGSCSAELVCSTIVNPVCGANGLSYPNACWAESLGTTVSSYGYCAEAKRFVSDLWLTKKVISDSFAVPVPQISFEYGDEGKGVLLRSTLHDTSGDAWTIDVDIDTENANTKNKNDFRVKVFGPNKPITSTGERLKTLMVYLPYKDIYPKELLLSLPSEYFGFLNDYFKKMQSKIAPVQYDVTSVVVDPPQGVTVLSLFDHSLPGEVLGSNKRRVYDAAVEKIGRKEARDFKVFIIVPIVGLDTLMPPGPPGGDGFTDDPTRMEVVHWIIMRDKAYSATDKQKGIDAFLDLQQMFNIVSHELVHGLGWGGDHIPSDTNSEFLFGIDARTGKTASTNMSWCEHREKMPNYYYAELPLDLRILVGEEPSWMEYKKTPQGGECLDYIGTYLKDYDKDGLYEIQHSFNYVPREIQAHLGWLDIDGDGYGELDDSQPYGGFSVIKNVNRTPGDQVYPDLIKPLKFQALGSVKIGDCIFEKIKLEDAKVGFTPLQCKEFNSSVVSIYKGLRYHWHFIEKDFGTVFLPRFLF